MSDGFDERAPIEVASDAELAALIALAGLPGLTPRRFWSLLELGAPDELWQLVKAGAAPRTGRLRDAALSWSGWCAQIDPNRELERHRSGGVTVLPYGHPSYPLSLIDDPEPPPLLFRQGPAEIQDRPRVAVVGTRKCTQYGRDVAHRLGIALAASGVDVVSGLASGIDAAAHAGAIKADPTMTIAVVAGGVDVIYPPTNHGLYGQIAQHGVLLSEWPLGARPDKWRFPARNRLVAALSAAVVVVESALRGGSMYTVDEAIERNRPVFAVPGPIHSPVSQGTHHLISEGAHLLGSIEHLVRTVAPDLTPRQTHFLITTESWLLDLIGWEPMDLETVVIRSQRSPSDVTLEVERLIGLGALRRSGAIVEQVAQ